MSARCRTRLLQRLHLPELRLTVAEASALRADFPGRFSVWLGVHCPYAGRNTDSRPARRETTELFGGLEEDLRTCAT